MEHACYKVESSPLVAFDATKPLRIKDSWRCEACDFKGNMDEAIAHAAGKQFVVRPQPRKE